MGMFVPKKIEIELSKDTKELIYHALDKIDLWLRNSIFWRGH